MDETHTIYTSADGTAYLGYISSPLNEQYRFLSLVELSHLYEHVFPSDVLQNYWCVLHLTGTDYYSDNDFLEIQQRRLTDVQVQKAASQMQPHFLYNALSSIRELVWIDQQAASDMIYNFTTHLRAVIHSLSKQNLIPFTEEIKNIQAYVSIEQMRFGDRLHVLYDLGVEDFDIVSLGLQPLVENAIRHGIYKKGKDGGTITIRSEKQDTHILVEVIDDGVGFDPVQLSEDVRAGKSNSTGLLNVQLRFEKLQNASLSIKSSLSEGTKVSILIPANDQTAG